MKSEDQDWTNEANLLSQLDHENIIKYMDHFEVETVDSFCFPCIVTEYCEVRHLVKITIRIERLRVFSLCLIEGRLGETHKSNQGHEKRV